MSMKVYVAGPLFTLAERRFNEDLASSVQAVADDIAVVLPQCETASMAGAPGFVQRAFGYCLHTIDECDAVVAILDGPDADSGTCVEIGYAYARGKPIVGVRTDIRLLEDRGLNLMVANICTTLIAQSSLTGSVSGLAEEIVTCLRGLRKGSASAEPRGVTPH